MKSSAAPAEQAEKSANPYNQGGQPVLPVPKEISPYSKKNCPANRRSPERSVSATGRERDYLSM